MYVHVYQILTRIILTSVFRVKPPTFSIQVQYKTRLINVLSFHKHSINPCNGLINVLMFEHTINDT